jgi:hypothetical protein
MKLHAEGAAVDLRRAQLDQLEQRLVEAGLCGRHAKGCDHIVGIGRQRFKIFRFAAGM